MDVQNPLRIPLKEPFKEPPNSACPERLHRDPHRFLEVPAPRRGTAGGSPERALGLLTALGLGAPLPRLSGRSKK